MDEDWMLLARRAGLDLAIKDHPADLQEAFRLAQIAANALARPTSPAEEPWPPMRVRTAP